MLLTKQVGDESLLIMLFGLDFERLVLLTEHSFHLDYVVEDLRLLESTLLIVRERRRHAIRRPLCVLDQEVVEVAALVSLQVSGLEARVWFLQWFAFHLFFNGRQMRLLVQGLEEGNFLS